jgi:hypothetical protein
MRRPKYLSPSALQQWQSNQEQYYLKYLANDRPPRFPQTEPMSVGSAFDAFVKSAIADSVFGVNEKPEFVLRTVFEKQVEEHNRDFAWTAGEICFESYKRSGAYASLMANVTKSSTEPRMEFTAGGGDTDQYGNPLGAVKEGEVILLGKPDLEFTLGDVKVLFDWKVNGYCSKAGISPAPGYRMCRDGWEGDKSRTHGKPHGKFVPYRVGDFEVSMTDYVETVKPDWGLQLATYHWLTGTPVGEQCVVQVDQLACRPGQKIRVAEHRSEISKKFQQDSYTHYQDLWEIIESGYIFRHMSKEESNDRCIVLDQQGAAFAGGTLKDEWYSKMMGRKA